MLGSAVAVPEVVVRKMSVSRAKAGVIIAGLTMQTISSQARALEKKSGLRTEDLVHYLEW